jgi:solute carrier family 25, member 42
MTACAATYPADLARARMAVTNKLQYRNLIQIFVKTYKFEGLIGLYRGFLPTLLGSIPYAGVGYFTYETLKRFHKSLNSEDPYHIQRVAYGALAGAAGQTASYPLDVIRRRMQTAALVNIEEKNLNAIELLKKIIKEEGLRKGLYKGLSMNWIKGPIAAGVGFATNDYLKAIVRNCYMKLFVVHNEIGET